MESKELLKKALIALEQMSDDEVKSRTSSAKVVFPEEMSIREQLNHFMFDLKGAFKETLNSRERWMPPEILIRKSVTIKDNKKSRKNVALSFLYQYFTIFRTWRINLVFNL